jgi:thiamine pyrophosphate-dependent acetolactate synthase large subunit-like protein
MGLPELETAVRLGVPLMIVEFNDAAHGAEVHHFGPDGFPADLVRFPDTELAALARGAGAAGVTVRAEGDLSAVAAWLGERSGPLLLDRRSFPRWSRSGSRRRSGTERRRPADHLNRRRPTTLRLPLRQGASGRDGVGMVGAEDALADDQSALV